MSIKNLGRVQSLEAISSITQEAFSELEYCYYKHVNTQKLSFTFSVSQDLTKNKSQSCQIVNISV